MDGRRLRRSKENKTPEACAVSAESKKRFAKRTGNAYKDPGRSEKPRKTVADLGKRKRHLKPRDPARRRARACYNPKK